MALSGPTLQTRLSFTRMFLAAKSLCTNPFWDKYLIPLATPLQKERRRLGGGGWGEEAGGRRLEEGGWLPETLGRGKSLVLMEGDRGDNGRITMEGQCITQQAICLT